jgi:hypothetical protein
MNALDQQTLLAVIRSASASARLAANDLDTIGTMLKAGWITCQEVIEALAELGLIDPAVVDAGWKEAAAEYRRDHPSPKCALARRNPAA